MSEILGGGYPGVNRTLNNPASTYPQMTGSLINQFEGLSGSPGQAAGDMARAAVYGQLSAGSMRGERGTRRRIRFEQKQGAGGASPGKPRPYKAAENGRRGRSRKTLVAGARSRVEDCE